MKINFSNLNNRQRTGLAALGGIFLALCAISTVPIFAFIALVPIIFCLKEVGIKSVIKNALIAGIAAGIFSNFWMIKTISEFADFKMGIFSYLFGIFLLCLVFLLMFLVFYPFVNIKQNSFIQILSIACGWAIIEFGISHFLTGAFWLQSFLYWNLLKYPFFIQPAVFGGSVFISFLLALINGALAYYIIDKKKQSLFYLIGSFLIFLGTSLLSIIIYPEEHNTESIKIALINNANPLHFKWDEITGNDMVQKMLQLNKKAYQTDADLHIWTESVVPWTFRKDDDFIQEIIKKDHSNKAGTIIGMLTDYNKDTFYNSAYYFETHLNNLQRYDKRFPLLFSEGPVQLFDIPILRSIDFVVMPGNQSNIFNTIKGKAGIVICNETNLNPIYNEIYKENPDFLVGISNDGWLANSEYLKRLHFYINRLRAIESRKDIVFNSNSGYSGGFNSMGKEIAKRNEAIGFIEQFSITKQKKVTFYSKNSKFFIYLYFLIGGFFLLYNYFIIHSK
ncbi:MAG TPA: apolipoprotein N-acyltransferase [Edaphocola sp.]|nr:apolipoprotein N-acyltransferase [Edaphocola sp.]